MYARVMTFHHQPDKIDRAIQLANDMVLPETKQEEGFLEFRVLVDRSKGKVVVITLYQTQEHLQAAGADMSHPIHQRRLSKFRSSHVAEPLVEIYEVAVQG